MMAFKGGSQKAIGGQSPGTGNSYAEPLNRSRPGVFEEQADLHGQITMRKGEDNRIRTENK